MRIILYHLFHRVFIPCRRTELTGVNKSKCVKMNCTSKQHSWKRALEAENARKTKELEEARQLQLSMLPKTLPKLSNLEISPLWELQLRSRDYYDFIIQTRFTKYRFGDATGHAASRYNGTFDERFLLNAAKLECWNSWIIAQQWLKEVNLGRILILLVFWELRITNWY